MDPRWDEQKVHKHEEKALGELERQVNSWVNTDPHDHMCGPYP